MNSKLRTILLILTLILWTIPQTGMAQGNMRNNNQQNTTNRDGSNSKDDDEDPCVDPDDKRNCWTLDPITGIRFIQPLDSSHVNLANRQTMPGMSMGLLHTGNLFSPHQINNFFDRRNSHDYLFVNAYSLFAYRPEDVLYYDTRIPFTNVSYFTSGSSLQSNDRLRINFAGNMTSSFGIGSFLDYVYARGEYTSQATKPLKWTSYLYYDSDQYKATITYNLSKLANQENGGISDREYVLNPDFYDNSFTEPHTMPINLEDTWNDMDTWNVHLNHNYDLGVWNEMINPEDSTDVWDEFTSVASIFHAVDFEHYDHTFRMNKNADQTDNKDYYKDKFINKSLTHDSTAYSSFSTYAGIRLNEGFNRWSQFGISAFIGYQHQSYTMMQDTLQYDFIERNHSSNNFFLGGQISRQQSKHFKFDATAKFCFYGDDKFGDLELTGNLQTVIPAGKKDSITVDASGYICNQNPSYLLNHYFSNHFKWSKDFTTVKNLHVEGKFRYSLTGTEARAGYDHISNYIYFDASDGLPRQTSREIDVFSAEFSQKLHWRALHFDNRVLLQTTTQDDILPLPSIVWESDLSLRFVIAKTLTTQLGCTGYYYSKYYAPTYQPATQQFCVQQDIKCGGYPLFNAYVNCNLKRIKFYFMYSGLGTNTFNNNVFLMPYYSLQSSRMEYGVVFDLQD